MAKKATTQNQIQTQPVWERKDRTYYLLNGMEPLTFRLKSRNIMWYDEEKGFEREIKYTTNQKTPFVDEFKGCLLYTSPSPRDRTRSRMPSSA